MCGWCEESRDVALVVVVRWTREYGKSTPFRYLLRLDVLCTAHFKITLIYCALFTRNYIQIADKRTPAINRWFTGVTWKKTLAVRELGAFGPNIYMFIKTIKWGQSDRPIMLIPYRLRWHARDYRMCAVARNMDNKKTAISKCVIAATIYVICIYRNWTRTQLTKNVNTHTYVDDVALSLAVNTHAKQTHALLLYTRLYIYNTLRDNSRVKYLTSKFVVHGFVVVTYMLYICIIYCLLYSLLVP